MIIGRSTHRRRRQGGAATAAGAATSVGLGTATLRHAGKRRFVRLQPRHVGRDGDDRAEAVAVLLHQCRCQCRGKPVVGGRPAHPLRGGVLRVGGLVGARVDDLLPCGGQRRRLRWSCARDGRFGEAVARCCGRRRAVHVLCRVQQLSELQAPAAGWAWQRRWRCGRSDVAI